MDRYFATYVQDLEQDPFDPSDFVERLVWRLTGGGDSKIEPWPLHRAFEEEISSLQMLSDQYQGKIQRLQNVCKEEEEEFSVTLDRLQKENNTANEQLKNLDDKIQSVAAKVVHLGDQLENVNAPRSRAYEALQLMQHFNEFLSDQPLQSEVFADPDRLLESGEIVNKLSLISQELSSDKYGQVQQRIQYKYDEIEKLMIEEFVRTHRMGQRAKLKQIAYILSNFKGYSECVNAFVEHIQIGAFRNVDIFSDILNLCQKTSPVLEEIFPNPEQVMAKLVLNMFHGKLQEYIQSKLSDTDDLEAYLANLYDLYSKTQKLSDNLQEYRVGSDKEFLPALIRALFSKYLDNYITIESHFLKEQCSNLLQKYYDSKGHQKRNIQSGGISDLKRDFQARILTPETYGGQTFLSEEIAISILQETKQAFQRCQFLSGLYETPINTTLILDILLQHLCQEHLEYAIELAVNGIPLSEPKIPPQSHFFGVVRQAAAICHLFEKQFDDSIVTIVKGTPQYEKCLNKKRDALYSLENKMSNGLDRQLNVIVGYIHFVLTNEQKKTDFRPEQEEGIIPLCSNACSTVVRFVNNQVERMSDSVDGDNLTAILNELGIRLHRTLLDHIYTFQYSSDGGMLLLCDINEYRKCVNEWKNGFVSKLFETLHGLSNLLVVVPENLNDACSAELLGDVDRSIVINFVQLRADYKNAKLYNEFR